MAQQFNPVKLCVCICNIKHTCRLLYKESWKSLGHTMKEAESLFKAMPLLVLSPK